MIISEGFEPYHHWVIDGLWEDDLLDQFTAEVQTIPDSEWFMGSWRERGHGRDQLPWKDVDWERFDLPACWAIYQRMRGSEFMNWLSDLTGVYDIFLESRYPGADRVPPGSLDLFPHTDCGYEAGVGYRRLNMLTYTNRVWESHWMAHLELYSDRDRSSSTRIKYRFNRTVLFSVHSESWHGYLGTHPEADPRFCFKAYYANQQLPPEDEARGRTEDFYSRHSEPLT